MFELQEWTMVQYSAVLRKNDVWAFRRCQSSFSNIWIFREICEYFLFAFFWKFYSGSDLNYTFEIFRSKYSWLFLKINISEEIWQLSNVQTAFFLSIAILNEQNIILFASIFEEHWNEQSMLKNEQFLILIKILTTYFSTLSYCNIYTSIKNTY